MTAFERLKLLCEKQGISVNDLEERLGIGRNSLYSWKKNIPKGTNLIKVADYFDVSTDYLLGRTDKPSPTSGQESVPDDLEKMLDNAMSFNGKPLTEKDREAIRAYMEGRLSSK
ncbi:MAG: helix-turn-helix transcriptional regulator [Enterococcus casseliflavus]|jgi:transcriptional regulator with XRE-family HTH domain|nr:helix-turn-helix transcriptional regulator [Enterococcus casseliflavus]